MDGLLSLLAVQTSMLERESQLGTTLVSLFRSRQIGHQAGAKRGRLGSTGTWLLSNLLGRIEEKALGMGKRGTRNRSCICMMGVLPPSS